MTFSDKLNIAVLIVNSIAALAAVVAAIIAIHGNRQSQAQFKSNMDAQKRANNLSMFDARTEILDQIKMMDFSFSIERANFLFKEDIMELIKMYLREDSERKNLLSIRKQYISCVNGAAAANSWEDAEESRDFQREMVRYEKMNPGENCTEEEYASMRELMRQYPVTFKVDGPECEWVIYSLGDIDTKIEKCFQEQESIKNNLINQIREFIQISAADTAGSLKP